jgi:uncharacterized membrane protein
MIWLIAAAAAFLLIHLVISGTRVRDAITGAIGEGPYMGLFSLTSVVCLVWLGIAYVHAQRGGADPQFWGATTITKWIQLVVTFVAFMLIVPGLLTPNPTSVRQEGQLSKPDAVRGVLRVSRHPFLWGVALWAAGHLMVNGDLASLILFGALLVLAILGTGSIDGKRRRKLGDAWDGFAAQTSAVPFAAIAAGRQSLNLGEIGWWRLGVAVIVWGALVFAHPFLFGVNPLPGH